MRRSSLTSEPALFGGLYARGEAASQLGDAAWLQAMLDVEAALARACAEEGLIPAAAAPAIAAVCEAGRFDLSELARETALHASPVVPLVAALRALGGGSEAQYVHAGATSQDVLDTALMLSAHRALGPLLCDARAAADGALSARRGSGPSAERVGYELPEQDAATGIDHP